MTEAGSVEPTGATRSAGLHLSTARGRWVLTATVLGSSMAQLDATVVGIAQPTIGREFHSTIAGLEWISVGYLLSLAGLLLLSGALSDRFGRRRLFVIGVTWFAVASLICATVGRPTSVAFAEDRAYRLTNGGSRFANRSFKSERFRPTVTQT